MAFRKENQLEIDGFCLKLQGNDLILGQNSKIGSRFLTPKIYIYNQLRYLRMSVFPIMQLNSNAPPLRICPHFVLICFLPIWPLLWKPLYTSMQPVSAFFSSSFHILIQFSCQLRGHPGNPCIGGPGASFNPKPRLALETRHLWGAPFAAAKKAIL